VEELDEAPTTPPPGFADPTSYSEDQIDKLLVLMRGGPGKRTRLVPLGVSFSHQTLTIEVYRAELIGIGITIRGAGGCIDWGSGDGSCRRAGSDG
jgi:hypothetical protein